MNCPYSTTIAICRGTCGIAEYLKSTAVQVRSRRAVNACRPCDAGIDAGTNGRSIPAEQWHPNADQIPCGIAPPCEVVRSRLCTTRWLL